jgi:hypothetical protein
MHPVRAEVAGCYANSDDLSFRLGLAVTLAGAVGRPSPMAVRRILFAVAELAIVDGARPCSRRMRPGLQYLKADQSG